MKVTTKVNKVVAKRVTVALVAVALVVLGASSVLLVQDKISNFKAQGVAEYKALHCTEYVKVYEDKSKQTWLECDS